MSGDILSLDVGTTAFKLGVFSPALEKKCEASRSYDVNVYGQGKADIEPEKWWLMQLVVKDSNCLVRINGETVLEYDKLENLEPGRIELQAHSAGRWTEFKQMQIRRL